MGVSILFLCPDWTPSVSPYWSSMWSSISGSIWSSIWDRSGRLGIWGFRGVVALPSSGLPWALLRAWAPGPGEPPLGLKGPRAMLYPFSNFTPFHISRPLLNCT